MESKQHLKLPIALESIFKKALNHYRKHLKRTICNIKYKNLKPLIYFTII